MSNLTDYLQLEHEIADLIHETVHLFRRAHTAPTQNEQDTAYAEHQRSEERLKELLDRCKDHAQLKRAVLGAIAIV